MDDVGLFARLMSARDGGATPSAEELAADLSALGAWPIARRVPWLCVLRGALGHRDARVREAAIRVLHGADGRMALSHFVKSLDDESHRVRVAAVAALRVLLPRDPARWAHVVFHPREDVRKESLVRVQHEVEEGTKVSPLCFYLLADPACRRLLEPLLGSAEQDACVSAPPNGLTAVFRFVERGALTPNQALRLFAGHSAQGISSELFRGPSRDERAMRILTENRLPPVSTEDLDAASASEDALDALFFVLAQADDPRKRRVCSTLALHCWAKPLPERRRLVAAARAAAHRFGEDDQLALLTAVLDSQFLLLRRVPIDVRRRAAAALASVTHRLLVPEKELVCDMVNELALEGERVMLDVAAGLVRMARSLAPLVDEVPLQSLLEAMSASPSAAATILLVPDDGKRGRKWLLEKMSAHDTAMTARALSWLAMYAPADRLDFVEELDAADAMLLARCVVEHERDMALKPNKRERLVALIVARLGGDGEGVALGDHLLAFTRHLLSLPHPEERRFGRALFEKLADAVGGEVFAMKLCTLPDEAVVRLVALTVELTRLPYGCELALASVMTEHPDAEVQGWARARVPVTEPPPPRPVPQGVLHLDDARVAHIATCPAGHLPAVMDEYRRVPTVRLVDGLVEREAAPSVETCAALLGCHDSPEEVAAQLSRFSDEGATFARRFEQAAVRWESCDNLPWVGAAWLWRWERHAFALAEQMTTGPPHVFLERALHLSWRPLRVRVWRGIAEALWVWSVREVERVHLSLAAGKGGGGEARHAERLVDLLIAQLDTDVDVGAARMFVALHRAGVAAAIDAVERVKARLPDIGEAAREHLSAVSSARGLARRARGPRKRVAVERVAVSRVRTSRDVDELAAWCESADAEIVQEAALVAIELGGVVLDRLAALVLRAPAVPCRHVLIESIPLWPKHRAIAKLRTAATDSEHGDELRFRLCVAFDERGEPDFLSRAVQAAHSSDPSWLRARDYDRLCTRQGELETALALATSAQPHAYLRAVPVLLAAADRGRDAEVADALRAFLLSGSERLEDLRVDAARWLHRRGDPIGFPLLFGSALNVESTYGRLFKGLPDSYVDGVADAALLAGPIAVSEGRVVQILEPVHVAHAARDRAYERLLVDAALERTAERIMSRFASRGVFRTERDSGLSQVANVFAWGTRVGLALTRRRHRVHMSERQQLGYTRFDQDAVWVNALPILRGDRHGKQIVEALILHEIGHHRHHRGEGAKEVWDEANRDGIFGLLNLVADEHLERNLRSVDATYGDRLKRLAAYAFRHACRELAVSQLLAMLGDRAFEVLTGCELGVARDGECVRVDSGNLLSAMERRGLAFARFMCALRMGLGNRYQDPKVAEGLGLFTKRFKHYSMAELLEVTRELQRIFGWETTLCGTYGGHETGGESSREQTRWGRGLSDADVQKEVERVLNPGKRRTGGGDGGRRWINVSEDGQFDAIHNVQRVPPDLVRHREAARDVVRHARTLRGLFERLGLASRPVRQRLKGTRLDRGRLTALVTRRDPRVLVSREIVRNTDLFLGVVVDCSGSMSGGDNMAKARRFAVLVADAVRDLPGVDARFFGFTDTVIYDAGDARRCGAASLEPGGGNNDAAALLHAATVAKQSRRKAKVLVMISDGLPTECSTSALKGLVARLSRSMVVAQVAVCPLEEVCFPHYIVLEGELESCVRRFGTVVGRLVARSL